MILNFADKGTEDLYHGVNSARSRRIPSNIRTQALRKLDMVNAAVSLNDLKVPPRNILERLSGDMKEFHSIRINDQWRIVLRWTEGAAESVEIIDYHR